MFEQVLVIENKFIFEGRFKTIYPLSKTIQSVTVMEVDYVDNIQRFIIEKFKVLKARDPWMYDPLGVFMETMKSNKKTPTFKHHLHSHIECYTN